MADPKSYPPFDHPPKHALIIGASGGIGQAMTAALLEEACVERVVGISRNAERITPHPKLLRVSMDLENESSIQEVAQGLADTPRFSWIVVAAGFLHDQDVFPERSYKEIKGSAMTKLFAINAVGPAMVARHFVPLLEPSQRSVFAALGARVGSIEDNRAGGWFSYRASKAALVMIMKTLSIELGRTLPKAIALTLHPGTVRTSLSAPFVGPKSKRPCFSPEHSAAQLLRVIDQATLEQSGEHLAYDGSRIVP